MTEYHRNEEEIIDVKPNSKYLVCILLASGEFLYVDVRGLLSEDDIEKFNSITDSFQNLSLENNNVVWPVGISIPCSCLLEACAPTSSDAIASTIEKGKLEQLEKEMALLNNNYFLPQFTYPITSFELSSGMTQELADHLVLIKGRGLLFQLKRQDISSSVDFPSWFENKVQRKGKKQIRNSLNLLKECIDIPVTNSKGHKRIVRTSGINEIHSVICYQANHPENPISDSQRWINSESTGFIHVFEMSTYEYLLSHLVTYSELLEYLSFRKNIVLRWQIEGKLPSEKALLGQFIKGDDSARPSEKYANNAEHLINNRDEFDLSYFLKDFERDMNHYDSKSTEYEEILSELAILNRQELRLAKERLIRCIKFVVNGEDLFKCFRFISPVRNICYLFLGLKNDICGNAEKAFINLSCGCKYDTKVERQIAVGVWKEGSAFRFRWAYIDGPWQYYEPLEKMLQESNPFREMNFKIISRYEVE